MLLEEMIQKTNSIFFTPKGKLKKLELPEPPIYFKNKLEALKQLSLVNHYTSYLLNMRCWQAEKLGFQKIVIEDMIKILMKEEATQISVAKKEQQFEWIYDHHKDEIMNSNWMAFPRIFKKNYRKDLWYFPPFSKICKWTVILGFIDYLKKDIPCSIISRINECKKAKIFNSFCVLAPQEAWINKTYDINSILLGAIQELPFDKKTKEIIITGKTEYFFIAKW